MVIVKLMGGLGNQLQQYALYQKFISMDRDAYLDLSWFDADVQEHMAAKRECELKLFTNADFKEATKDQVKSLIGDGSIFSKIRVRLHNIVGGNKHYYETQMYDERIFQMDDVYLEGYWAAEKYYADILPLLREKLSFDIDALSDANREVARNILGEKGEDTILSNKSCAVHIRRGDYLDPINQEIFGNIATEKYYETAIDYVRERYPNTRFYVFTDDIAYAQEKYGREERFTMIDINHGLDSRYDIYLMSLCDMHICANSTFSFWGVRLSEGHLNNMLSDENHELNIRPTIQKNTQVFDESIMKDLWKGWSFIDPLGVVH